MRSTLFETSKNPLRIFKWWVFHTSLEDSSGILWVANGDGQIDKFDPKEHPFKVYKTEYPNSISSNTAVPVFEDSRGLIWIGMFGSGLDMYDRTADKFYNFPSIKGDNRTLPHGYPSGLMEDRDGNFIVSTAGGVVVFD